MSHSNSNRAFDRVLIIMFENMYRSYVMKNEYMRSLTNQGIDMANYMGVMHPSQTNYIASIAGELCNMSDDDPPSPLLRQQTIVDLLEAKGLRWRAYMDGYSVGQNKWRSGLVPQNDFPYVIKHNPFTSFENIVNNEARWNNIVNQDQFFRDVAAGNLPEYAWFTPNMWHDGHYSIGTTVDPKERAPALVDQQATWLKYFLGMLKFPGVDTLLPPRTLVVVTYDESDFEAKIDVGDKYTYDGPNQIYTVLLSSGSTSGVESSWRNRVEPGGYNHYSLLRTIEENFQLGSLNKNDRDASYFQFLWGREFSWRKRSPIPVDEIAIKEVFDVVEYHGRRYLMHSVTHDAKLYIKQHHEGVWSNSEAVGEVVARQAFFAPVDDTLLLLYSTPGGIEQLKLSETGAWINYGEHVITGEVKVFAVTRFDRGRCLMLVWSNSEGLLQSLVYTQGKWAAELVPVGGEGSSGFRTTGQLCLGRCGASLFCIYEAEHRNSLMVVDYNTEPCNVVSVPDGKYGGSYDDTTVHRWSSSAFPISEFLHAPSPVTPGEDEPVSEFFPGCGPLACASLDGVLHLVHLRSQGRELVTETFSIAGLLTPKLPISYASGEQSTTSNGYGTLAQAGWSDQRVLSQADQGQYESIAMCRTTTGIWLISIDSKGQLQLFEGVNVEESAVSDDSQRARSDRSKSLRSVS